MLPKLISKRVLSYTYTLSIEKEVKIMGLNLSHLEKRVKELASLAHEVLDLGQRKSSGEDVQFDLSVKGQRWYRGARELLVQQNFSGLNEFTHYYTCSFTDKIS